MRSIIDSFVFVFAAQFFGTAGATVIFSNLEIKSSEFSITLSGSLPLDAPPSAPSFLIFVNSDQFAEPGFVVRPSFEIVSTSDFSGNQNIFNSSVGPERFGDYLLFEFEDDFLTGENITGTITASWPIPIFDPKAPNSLNVYWGAGEDLRDPTSVFGGIFLGSVSVPEASSTLLLGLGAISALSRRKKNGSSWRVTVETE
jgi:hypothetical protein